MSKPTERQIKIFGFQVTVPARSDEGTQNEKPGLPATQDRVLSDHGDVLGKVNEKKKNIIEDDFLGVTEKQNENVALPTNEDHHLLQHEEPKKIAGKEKTNKKNDFLGETKEKSKKTAKGKGKVVEQDDFLSETSEDSIEIITGNGKRKVIVQDDFLSETSEEDEEIAYPDTQDCKLFEDEELSGIVITEKGQDFIQVDCGCTNRRLGDYVGKLKVYRDGKLEVSCLCYPGCEKENVRPIEFERHAGIIGPSRWKSHIWVPVNGSKRPLYKTILLKYYIGSPNDPSSKRKRGGMRVHKDEFLTCSACGKNRRFECRDQQQCWLYHQAYLARDRWTCSDFPYYEYVFFSYIFLY
ncbi:hypothetical protein RND81_12G232400 [Saponaria officinalis]|uniref:Uncharacterized protein n=1 Tax=Saponaria officinalis TaxID=3572 RepID=A0AAW1HEF9_SAPOF